MFVEKKYTFISTILFSLFASSCSLFDPEQNDLRSALSGSVWQRNIENQKQSRDAKSGEPSDESQLNLVSYESHIEAILQRTCNNCHAGDSPAMNFRTDLYHDEATLLSHKMRWDQVLAQITGGNMPPSAPLPPPTMDLFKRWQELGYPETLVQAKQTAETSGSANDDLCDDSKDAPLRQRLNRLTKSEYLASLETIAQGNLAASDLAITSILPEDAVDGGFSRSIDVETDTHHFAYLEIALTIAKKMAPIEQSRLKPDCAGPCLETWIKNTGLRIFRRPLIQKEITSYLNKVDDEHLSLTGKAEVILAAMLASPHFVFFLEISDSPDQKIREDVYKLSPFELATRLSYFITGAPPDQTLLNLAAGRQLEMNLEREIERLLQKEGAKKHFLTFFDEWAEYQPRGSMEYDPAFFPGLQNGLRQAAIEEVEGFVTWQVFDNNGSLQDLFLSTSGRVAHEGLASVYGVSSSLEPQDINRPGFLTRAAFLAGDGENPHAIIRGAKILNTIMCTTTTVPELDVVDPTTQQDPSETMVTSSRHKWEKLTSQKKCSGCHDKINPLGFVFNGFDTVGRQRSIEKVLFNESYHEVALDSNISYVIDGTEHEEISGPDGIAPILAESQLVHQCFTTSLAKFAYGKRTNEISQCVTQDVSKNSLAGASILDTTKALILRPAFLQKAFAP